MDKLQERVPLIHSLLRFDTRFHGLIESNSESRHTAFHAVVPWFGNPRTGESLLHPYFLRNVAV